jgi:hypothetical protein
MENELLEFTLNGICYQVAPVRWFGGATTDPQLTWKQGGNACAKCTAAGFDDWIFPTIDMLKIMFKEFHDGENFATSFCYWSSSSARGNNAWSLNFISGHSFDSIDKGCTCFVRPVRVK